MPGKFALMKGAENESISELKAVKIHVITKHKPCASFRILSFMTLITDCDTWFSSTNSRT